MFLREPTIACRQTEAGHGFLNEHFSINYIQKKERLITLTDKKTMVIIPPVPPKRPPPRLSAPPLRPRPQTHASPPHLNLKVKRYDNINMNNQPERTAIVANRKCETTKKLSLVTILSSA